MQVGKEEPEEGSMVEVEDTDDYLLYLEDILKTVHKVRYSQWMRIVSRYYKKYTGTVKKYC
jgi:hypothetical protein